MAMGQPRSGTRAYTHPVEPPPDPDANHVEYLERLAGPFGVAPADVPHPTLWLSDEEQDAAERGWVDAGRAQHGRADAAVGPRLLVNVSAGHRARRWGDAQFVAAIRHVRATHPGSTVLVVGGPAERTARDAIAHDAGVTAPATPGIRSAFALVARADGVLTPDTSIAHVASAFRKPCVTLMLPGAEPFTPYRTPGEVVMSPVMEMTAVPVEAVTRALDALFGLLAASRPRRSVDEAERGDGRPLRSPVANPTHPSPAPELGA
jgi:ADP-heptose:LPS heptosyltransferase